MRAPTGTLLRAGCSWAWGSLSLPAARTTQSPGRSVRRRRHVRHVSFASPTPNTPEAQIEAAVRAYYAELTRAASDSETNDTSTLDDQRDALATAPSERSIDAARCGRSARRTPLGGRVGSRSRHRGRNGASPKSEYDGNRIRRARTRRQSHRATIPKHGEPRGPVAGASDEAVDHRQRLQPGGHDAGSLVGAGPY